MIFGNDINSIRKSNYESTINNLEKAKAILVERYAKKQISDADYVKKSKEINMEIEKYKKMIGEEY